MIIYSEKTNKAYNSVESCLNAEKEYDLLKQKEEEERLEKEQVKKTREAELAEARETIKKAQKHYSDLLNAYTKDYGSDPFDVFRIVFR